MPGHPTSPQDKKRLSYDRDHFSAGEHNKARRDWSRKKATTNRRFRRKSDELFVEVKVGMDADVVSQIAEDITVARIQKSVTRKRLQKSGARALGERVPQTFEKRAARVNHRVGYKTAQYKKVASAISTMTALRGEELIEFIRRYALLSRGGDPIGYQRMMASKKPLDRALCFLYEWQHGFGVHRETVCGNEGLKDAFDSWAAKANRVLDCDRRAIARKQAEKELAGKKINARRRSSAKTS